jgi:hypothetical protein
MIQTVDFFGRKVTRLILGDNPFNGHSYIEEIHSGDEMIDYYTANNCVKALFEAEESGINTYMALAEPFVLRVIRQYKNDGGKMNIMFQTYPALDLEINLRMMLKCNPIGIYHQGGQADLYCEKEEIDTLRMRLKLIKDTGVPTGLGTHVPETVLRAEKEGWNADFYVTSLYNARRTQRGEESGFITGKTKSLIFYPEDRYLMFNVIRQIEKPVIAFKIFAGGQIFIGKNSEEIPNVAETYLREAYENIKPCDMVMLGVFQKYKNQIKENTDIARKVLKI